VLFRSFACDIDETHEEETAHHSVAVA